jgi:hypothetical protein
MMRKQGVLTSHTLSWGKKAKKQNKPKKNYVHVDKQFDEVCEIFKYLLQELQQQKVSHPASQPASKMGANFGSAKRGRSHMHCTCVDEYLLQQGLLLLPFCKYSSIYLLFSNPTHETKIGITNRWETTNSGYPLRRPHRTI